MLLTNAVKLLRCSTFERQPHMCSRKGFIAAMKTFILWLFSRISETTGEVKQHRGVWTSSKWTDVKVSSDQSESDG